MPPYLLISYLHDFGPLLQFLLIYRKARAGELEQDSGLGQLARLTEVDVDEVGVTGAKNFFEAKVEYCLSLLSEIKITNKRDK